MKNSLDIFKRQTKINSEQKVVRKKGHRFHLQFDEKQSCCLQRKKSFFFRFTEVMNIYCAALSQTVFMCDHLSRSSFTDSFQLQLIK